MGLARPSSGPIMTATLTTEGPCNLLHDFTHVKAGEDARTWGSHREAGGAVSSASHHHGVRTKTVEQGCHPTFQRAGGGPQDGPWPGLRGFGALQSTQDGSTVAR